MAGASKAYGEWASSKIKGRRGALLSTAGLGLFIFIDDYFNCLTVGSVMRPVTDKFKISREKLAYICDATSAPVNAIIPLSSWGAFTTLAVMPALSRSLALLCALVNDRHIIRYCVIV